MLWNDAELTEKLSDFNTVGTNEQDTEDDINLDDSIEEIPGQFDDHYMPIDEPIDDDDPMDNHNPMFEPPNDQPPIDDSKICEICKLRLREVVTMCGHFSCQECWTEWTERQKIQIESDPDKTKRTKKWEIKNIKCMSCSKRTSQVIRVYL